MKQHRMVEHVENVFQEQVWKRTRWPPAVAIHADLRTLTRARWSDAPPASAPNRCLTASAERRAPGSTGSTHGSLRYRHAMLVGVRYSHTTCATCSGFAA